MGPCVPRPRCCLPVSPMIFGTPYRCGGCNSGLLEDKFGNSMSREERDCAIAGEISATGEKSRPRLPIGMLLVSARNGYCACLPTQSTPPAVDEKLPRDEDATRLATVCMVACRAGPAWYGGKIRSCSSQTVSGTLPVINTFLDIRRQRAYLWVFSLRQVAWANGES